MAQESMEVKVAKLETKMDTLLENVGEINKKLDRAESDYVKRNEFASFKEEFKRKRFQQTLLTSIVTFVVTALLSYFIFDIGLGQ